MREESGPWAGSAEPTAPSAFSIRASAAAFCCAASASVAALVARARLRRSSILPTTGPWVYARERGH